MSLGFRMHAERTPNPNSVKWVLGQPVAKNVGAVYFEAAPEEGVSPLAARLFEVEGVTAVLLGPEFVTVTKRADLEWTDLAPPIVAGIKQWAGSEEDALGPDWEPPDRADEGEVVARIRQIIEEDVQPYVAMDGGEIAFSDYRDGIVEVVLRGACAGCPSSTITLKMGIEARLKQAIPEVVSVVAV